jgi:histidine ammonia-lyase
MLAAAQGIELRRPLRTSPALQAFATRIRQHSAFLEQDRPLHRDIRGLAAVILEGGFAGTSPPPDATGRG